MLIIILCMVSCICLSMKIKMTRIGSQEADMKTILIQENNNGAAVSKRSSFHYIDFRKPANLV